jgi:SAM-dependent methyltransferase
MNGTVQGCLEVTYPINRYLEPRIPTLQRLWSRWHWVGSILARLPAVVQARICVEKVSVNARVVEHPWVCMNLGLQSGRILDVGCCESSISIELASLGFEVWGIDSRPYGLTHPNFRFVCADICNPPLPENYFDRVLAISTIEHVGIGHYGDPRGNEKDLFALEAVYRLLKPGGRLLISAPFGHRRMDAFTRVYDAEQFRRLLQGFKILKIEWHKDHQGSWIKTEASDFLIGETEKTNRCCGNVIALAEK